jgi:hypothetical protein
MLGLAVVRFPRQIYPVPTESSLQGYTKKEQADIQQARLTLQNSLRGTLVQGFGGLLVLITASLGGYFTLQQVRVSRDGQLTDRFTKATDQLGNESDDVRIGGIYTLERIARNSPDDRRAIAEVLNAFVRRRTQGSILTDGGDPLPLPQRLADVQAAMDVLGQPLFEANAVRLPFVDLRNAVLPQVHLVGAVLREANLATSDLREAVLREARLENATLERADLRGADLQRAHLQHANLRGAKLQGADLRDARLEEAELRGAHDSLATRWPAGFDRAARGIVRGDEMIAVH